LAGRPAFLKSINRSKNFTTAIKFFEMPRSRKQLCTISTERHIELEALQINAGFSGNQDPDNCFIKTPTAIPCEKKQRLRQTRSRKTIFSTKRQPIKQPERIFIVNRLLAARRLGARRYFLVEWDVEPRETTWEPEDNLIGSGLSSMIGAFNYVFAI